MASKFYAVKKGKIPGIYNSWDDCKKMVDGFPGAVYKSFKTLEEAEAFVLLLPFVQILFRSRSRFNHKYMR